MPDTWEADPLVLGRDTEWQVTLARGRDGAWRFDRGTVARVPDLFDRLTPEEKTARERRSSFHSARQTMRTLLQAADAGDLDLAARCLDLDGIPAAARDELGPILAYKLKFVARPDRPGGRGGDPRRGERPPVLLPPRPARAASTWSGRKGRPAAATGSSRARPSPGSRRMFRDGVDRPIAPGLDARQGRPRPPVVPTGPLAVAPLPPPRLAAQPGGWGSTCTSGSDWPSPWRPPRPPPGRGSGLAERLACRLLRLVRVEVERVVVAPKLRPLAVAVRPVVPVPAAPHCSTCPRRPSGPRSRS